MFDTLVHESERGASHGASLDELEQELLAGEALIARVRARQMHLIDRLDAAQIALADGCRTMAEWLASRLDVAPETASLLVRLARDPVFHADLAAGGITFDRADATTRLTATDAPPEAVDASRGLDIAGVRRLAARWKRITRAEEADAFEDRHIAIQPNLDSTMWQGWFRLSGVDGKILEDALSRRADELPDDTEASRRQRMADALVAIAQDALDGGGAGSDGTGRTPLISLFADADIMAATNNQAGVEVPAGPRAGIGALEELICNGSLEWIRRTPDERLLGVGRKSRIIPAPLRRAVIARDGGCVADGCHSRYRLQAHHVLPWTRGGHTDPDNLITLCWYHHHVVIHGRGKDIDPESPPGRVRFIRRGLRGPPG